VLHDLLRLSGLALERRRSQACQTRKERPAFQQAAPIDVFVAGRIRCVFLHDIASKVGCRVARIRGVFLLGTITLFPAFSGFHALSGVEGLRGYGNAYKRIVT
jgi:hypothetical protein